MCGTAYNLSEVGDEPIIHGFVIEVGVPTTGGSGFWRRGKMKDTYVEEGMVGTDMHEYTGVMGFWDLCRMCVFDFIIVDMDAPSYKRRHPTCILSHNEQHQKGKYLKY